ncbi:two-component sensor histidine kinase [Actinoplanes capillaceus]|uniref:histidine kinase n=1 Tax=Actinoplanes campanulatus TaxID=113559 RepID=A0ABQ3WNQ0_9ACTN|nr:histidine kinase [Actinoplanes capillaceus]GID47832.1 two-component sensor histidine kinase [Actinoplanes capillaceus]
MWARLRRRSETLPPLSWRGQVFDVLVAAALALAAVSAGTGTAPSPELFPPAPPGHGDDLLELLLLLVGPLVLRRRYPLTILWVVLAMAPMAADTQLALRLSFYACVIAAYTAAVYSPYRIPALAGLPVAVVLYSGLQQGPPAVPPAMVPLLILGVIAIAAAGLRRWKQQADEDRARMSELERERSEALDRATGQERARIARELHDVVTHNVSMMVIQAGAARKVLDSSPEQTREALLTIEAGGRAAMTELRHVMGLLTMDGAADLAPQPGLDRLGTLVGLLADSGVPVTLARSGEPRPVPPGAELTAYRVVQEALTNTVKHASGATARVLVEYGDDQLRLEVTDTGGTAGPQAATGGGHGLTGLRERLAVHGGTLRAGPRVSGGYRVDARIPLESP